jgi:hypothetical protein
MSILVPSFLSGATRLPGNLLVPCHPAASLKGGTALVNLLRNVVETSSD